MPRPKKTDSSKPVDNSKSESSWSKVYNNKTDPKEINKEKGDFYELYTLYLIQPYLNKTQRRNLYNYVINTYARTAELYLKEKPVFESDVFLSLRRKSKFTRWLQKIVKIHDEFGLNDQCKKYKGPVNDDHVSYDSGQVCFAKTFGNNIIKNTKYKLGKNEEIFETIGNLYLTYNIPVFEKLNDSLDNVLLGIKNSYLGNGKISETFNGENYSFSISEVVDYTLDIEKRKTLTRKEIKNEKKKIINDEKKKLSGENKTADKQNLKVLAANVKTKEEPFAVVKYHILKIKTESDKKSETGSPEIYYAESNENKFKILEEKYKVDLGKLVLIKKMHKLLPDTYYIANIADEKNYDSIKETIETFLNPEMFGYTSPFGLEDSAKMTLNQVNGMDYTAESFADVFKNNKFFKEFKKFIDIPHYSVLRSSEGDLEGDIDKKLTHLIVDKNMKRKDIVKAVENFVIKD